MNDRLTELIDKIRLLETEFLGELEKKEREFSYEVLRKKVRFREEVRASHRKMVESVPWYLYRAALLNVLTAPVIWFCLLPALFMDVVLTAYQAICFPVYRIPKVKRSDYFVMDRQYLGYLNVIERLNCYYCGYFNGLMLYVEEIGARTEQYWCPIKHARKVKEVHSRYRYFLDYGDAEGYRKRLETIRRTFEDLS